LVGGEREETLKVWSSALMASSITEAARTEGGGGEENQRKGKVPWETATFVGVVPSECRLPHRKRGEGEKLMPGRGGRKKRER